MLPLLACWAADAHRPLPAIVKPKTPDTAMFCWNGNLCLPCRFCVMQCRSWDDSRCLHVATLLILDVFVSLHFQQQVLVTNAFSR